jgi:hypothetical protein
MTSSVDLSQISLFCATREQTLASRRRTHAQWAKGLSMPVYLLRDERLDQLDHTRDGRMRTWYDMSFKHNCLSHDMVLQGFGSED